MVVRPLNIFAKLLKLQEGQYNLIFRLAELKSKYLLLLNVKVLPPL